MKRLFCSVSFYLNVGDEAKISDSILSSVIMRELANYHAFLSTLGEHVVANDFEYSFSKAICDDDLINDGDKEEVESEEDIESEEDSLISTDEFGMTEADAKKYAELVLEKIKVSRDKSKVEA